MFVKGHLRRYATLLEINGDEILDAYERSKQHIDEPTLVPKARMDMGPVRDRPRWPLVIGGIAAFLLAAVLLALLTEYGLPWFKKSTETPPLDATLEVPSTSLTPTTEPVQTEPAAEPTEDGTAPAETASGTESTVASPGATTADTVSPGSPATAATMPAGTTAAATTSTAMPETAVAPPPPGLGQVTLQLRFNGDSWVEIFDGTGKAVVYELGKTGTVRTVTVTAPLSVTLGNAPSVAVTINGRAVPAPPATGAVARFSVGADGNVR